MDTKFTPDLQLAINAATRLQSNTLYLGEGIEVPRAVWSGFVFFSRIEAPPFRRVQRIEAQEETLGYWVVERNINFYFRQQIICTVYLKGQKVDGQGKFAFFWEISKIAYFTRFDAVHPKRNEWIEIASTIQGFTLYPPD